MTDGAIAIILARGGSKGIPGKNLRKVAGISLVGRAISAAKNSVGVAEVYVSTDDAAIAEEATRWGAEVIERPAAIAGDTATSESGWLHAIESIRASGEIVPEVLVFLQCTSPFTIGEHIDDCLRQMAAQNADCTLSVIEDHSFLWRRNEDGNGRGINHDERQQRVRRQDLEPAYKENGAIYVVRRSAFETAGNRFCGKVALAPVDQPPFEIDSIADLEVCDAIVRTREGGAGPSANLMRRLGLVRALVMDFDGVHTDDRAWVDSQGNEAVTVSRRDGMGIERLRKLGRHKTVIVSKERVDVVHARARKLGVECYNQTEDKTHAIGEWLKRNELTWNDVLYVGNDVNDLGPLQRAGVSACPNDAHREVLAVADWIVPFGGGSGAVREICDRLIEAAGANG